MLPVTHQYGLRHIKSWAAAQGFQIVETFSDTNADGSVR